MTLAEKLEGAVDGIGLYGLSPPRLETPEDRQRELADQQRARIEGLGCDGLVVYDIQDEGDQRGTPPVSVPAHGRPLGVGRGPGAVAGAGHHLQVGAGDERDGAAQWLTGRTGPVVLVGAPSARVGALKLTDASALARAHAPQVVLGGVAIPERHLRSYEEHLRMLTKSGAGCQFFVTQAVYDVSSSLSVLSDYASWGGAASDRCPSSSPSLPAARAAAQPRHPRPLGAAV